MNALLRSSVSACCFLITGFVVGISVGVARSDSGHDSTMLAQARPTTQGTAAGLDMAAVEKAVSQAARAAFDKAAADALERLQKAALPPELATLRQRIGELDTLRNEVRIEIANVRSKMLHYALWGGVAFFGLMVLASVLGGAIVAALFRRRRYA